jgi:AcrR family transcriptional regulator
MPLIVDHDERRVMIANVVKRIIAESGMEAVTFRKVARVTGFSSTIVSHYFQDKRELLIYAYELVLNKADERVNEVLEAGGDLMACFELVLPNNEDNLRDWQAWFGFWGKATSDPALAAERRNGLDETQALFGRILQKAIERGELPPDVDVGFHASLLQMFLNGLVSFVIMQPEAWPPAAQRRALALQIDLIKQLPRGGL